MNKRTAAVRLVLCHPRLRDVLEGRPDEDWIEATFQAEEAIDRWMDAWRAHPAFDEWGRPGDVVDPIVASVYRHDEPGVDGAWYSYETGSVADLLSPIEIRWAERTLGTFFGLVPICPWMPVSDSRILCVSRSLKGGAKAYRARMTLKELLPRKLRPLISKARKYNSRPKWHYLADAWHNRLSSMEMSAEEWVRIRRTPSMQPEWYRTRTKGDLFIKRVLTDKERHALSTWMDVNTFWRAATGAIHPDDVADHVLHQEPLIDIDQYMESITADDAIDINEWKPEPKPQLIQLEGF